MKLRTRRWSAVLAPLCGFGLLASAACTPTAQPAARPPAATAEPSGAPVRSNEATRPTEANPLVRYLPHRGLLSLDDRPEVRFRVELAGTDAERSRGLMYRRQIPEDTGMLFDMGRQAVHAFWMRNTLASLDMLFLDRELKVVGLLHSVPTENDLPRQVDKSSWYVLELAAGTCARLKLGVGSQFVLQRTADGAADQPP